MPPQMTEGLKKAGAQISAMSLGQKVLAVIGIGVLLLGGSAFYTWVSKPDYVTAFSGLSGSDPADIRDLLSGAGIDAQIDGTSVKVPAEQESDATALAAQNGLPKGDSSSSDVLNAMGITATQLQQRAALQGVLESKIGDTLEKFDGVNTATVSLAIPEDTIFTDEKNPVTAAVMIDTGSHDATTDEVEAMQSLVARSVPNLKPADVSITDAKGELLTDGAGGAGKRDELTAGYEQKIQSKIQSQLDQVLGAGKAIASVTAELNLDAINRQSTTYTNSGALPNSSSTKTEEVIGGGSGVGGALGTNGVLGVDGTDPNAGADTGTGTNYKKTDQVLDNANNVVVDSTVVAPGNVEKQSVSVLVDQAALDKVGVQALQTAVSTTAGFDEARGDVVAVTGMTFDTSAKDAAAEQLQAAQAEQKSEEQWALIKQGAIALGVLLLAIVLLVAWRKAVKKGRRQPVDLGELERLYPEGATVRGDVAGAPTLASLAPANDSHLLVAPEPEPEALRRQEFGQLVDTQPAEVANLLRGWLAASKKG